MRVVFLVGSVAFALVMCFDQAYQSSVRSKLFASPTGCRAPAAKPAPQLSLRPAGQLPAWIQVLPASATAHLAGRLPDVRAPLRAQRGTGFRRVSVWTWVCTATSVALAVRGAALRPMLGTVVRHPSVRTRMAAECGSFFRGRPPVFTVPSSSRAGASCSRLGSLSLSLLKISSNFLEFL